MKFYETDGVKYSLGKQKYSSEDTHRFLMALLDIYGKEFIPVVSLILLCKNITTKNHQSHFKGPFANLLMVVSYSSVRFSRRATSSGIGPFSPLAYRCLLTNDHNRHTLVGKKMTDTISDEGQDKLTAF